MAVNLDHPVCLLLSPESLFTANDCFPGGSTCDLVRVRLRLNQGDRNSSLPEHHHTVVEEEFPEQHNLVLLSNTSSNFPPRSQHADVSFRAFGRRFRLRLSADNFDASSSNFPARGSSDWNRTANGAALSGCFFSGHLVNRGGRSRTRITSASVNLCGKGVVSSHFFSIDLNSTHECTSTYIPPYKKQLQGFDSCSAEVEG